mgnify:CR=1 FL=1
MANYDDTVKEKAEISEDLQDETIKVVRKPNIVLDKSEVEMVYKDDSELKEEVIEV